MTIKDYVETLLPAVSTDRLEAYRSVSNSDDLNMLINYYWNIKLCEALYPSLQSLEISLRNGIHGGLTERFKTPAWYDHAECLELRQQHAVIDAKIEIIKRKGRNGLTPGRVVAGLSFGFWTTLLNNPYERRLWKPDRYALLVRVFPYVPNHMRTRDKIFRQFNAFRELRNRVFHFEPIWNSANLDGTHTQICEAIGWISPAMRDSIMRFDRFPVVHQSGRAHVEAELKRHLGL